MKKVEKTSKLFLMLLLGVATVATSCRKEGCTDPEATNYNADAKKDDGSCEYQGTNQGSVEITSSTTELSGKMHGVLEGGKTYYLVGDLFIECDREIVMEAGARIESTGDGTPGNSPSIYVDGSFYSLGTEQNPNWITTTPDKRSAANYANGYIGTIESGDCTKDMVFKWTHLEFLGGPSGPGSAIYDEGETRKGIRTLKEDLNLIIEDSWFFGTREDAIRPDGGRISIMRNTFELCGYEDGEGVNVKGGTVGDIAYNVFIGVATNGPKIANSGGKPTQANINTYNNTILTSGFRRVAPGRGASINYENGARGKVYNNAIINCRFGLRIVQGTDYANLEVGHNYYFGNGEYEGVVFEDEFYASSGVIPAEYPFPATDITDNDDPMFQGYDVNQFANSDYLLADQLSHNPLNMNTVGSQNLRLAPGSPLIGAGYTGFTALNSTTATGAYAATVTQPSADIGAYPTDGSGNKHN
jgi:hypothetical protein